MERTPMNLWGAYCSTIPIRWEIIINIAGEGEVFDNKQKHRKRRRGIWKQYPKRQRVTRRKVTLRGADQC